MSGFSFKKLTPHITALVVFFLLAAVYFSPMLEGKRIRQSDVMNYYGMSKECNDYKDKTGETALWTNAMFGGMPTYLITNVGQSNLFVKIHQLFTLFNWRPVSLIFLYLLGFYLALLAFGINPWLSIAGALAYGFSTYFIIILEPGHITKAMALGYMPAIIGGVYYAYRKKMLLGASMTGAFLALQLLVNHLQITYYTAIILAFLGIAELIFAIRSGKIKAFAKTTGVLVIFAGLAVGTNFTNLYLIYEYGKYSMRGPSELTSDKDVKTSGLDRDYATDWSYGKAETFTLLVPNLMGGASGYDIGTGSATYDVLKSQIGPGPAKEAVKQMPMYWGSQPFTSGPVYVGAGIIFLFVLGLILIRGNLKWWILGVTVLSIMLAWGKNFMGFTNFFFDYVPGYDKFRTVSMILIMAEFTLPLLAIITFDRILKQQLDKAKVMKALKVALGIVGGFALLFALIPGAFFDFSGLSDGRYAEMGYPITQIVEDRESMVRMDAFRSLVFILLTAGVVWLVVKGKIKTTIAVLVLGILLLIDLWPVNKRFVNNDMFVSKAQEKQPFVATAADKEILKDKDPNYRVFNVAVNTFNDASTSYFHKSVGGYHGAKMKRYQEVIEHHIAQQNMEVLNMLNTKYFIIPTKESGPVPQMNPYALGNAWFVDTLTIVNNADEEINALTGFNPATTAIMDKRFSKEAEGWKSSPDSMAVIKQTLYSPNKLTYESSTSSTQLAVFSEIYYDKGWNAFIDGQPAPHFRVNYILRAMVVPSGKHQIEFRFEPKGYVMGEKISLASSSILLLMMAGAIFLEYRKGRKKLVQVEDEEKKV